MLEKITYTQPNNRMITHDSIQLSQIFQFQNQKKKKNNKSKKGKLQSNKNKKNFNFSSSETFISDQNNYKKILK